MEQPHDTLTYTSQDPSLTDQELRGIDAYWRACNYLSLAMIYLRDNPLLREPLRVEHLKKRFLGHWGSAPGQSFADTLRSARMTSSLNAFILRAQTTAFASRPTATAATTSAIWFSATSICAT